MNRDEYATELRTYLVGIGLALLLSAIPFALVATQAASRAVLLGVMGACAIVQVVVHFRCFLHIDLSRQRRDDLQLILFSTLIVLLMVGGTLWVLLNQKALMG